MFKTLTINLNDMVILNAVGNTDVRITGTVEACVFCTMFNGKLHDIESVTDASRPRITKIVSNTTGDEIHDDNLIESIERSLLTDLDHRFRLMCEIKQVAYEMMSQNPFPASPRRPMMKTPVAFAASVLPKHKAR